MEVFVDDDSKLTLHGLQQHYVKLKDNEKNRKLFELLDVLEFNQVITLLSSLSKAIVELDIQYLINLVIEVLHIFYTEVNVINPSTSFSTY